MVLIAGGGALAALLVVVGTLAQRRFGDGVGGLLVGLPLTSLPLLWVVSLSHGERFTGAMATAALVGLSAQAAVTWAYARAAVHLDPAPAMAAALAAFAAVAALGVVGRPSPVVAAGAATVTLGAALWWWPTTTGPEPERGRYRLGLRTAPTTAFVVAVSLVAGVVGPGVAGVATALPVLSLVMASVTHRELGSAATVRFLRGVAEGTFSVVAALLTVAELVGSGHRLAAFPAAAAVALATQAALLGLRAPAAAASGSLATTGRRMGGRLARALDTRG